jgi:hypothetical protein
MHSLLDGCGPEIARTHGQAAVHRFCTPIEFLAQMPSNTMIFITTAVLGFAATLIGLKWLI